MNQTSTAAPASAGPDTSAWETEIHGLERAACECFLDGNVAVLGQLLADDFVVNSPLQQILDKPRILELVGTGRIRHGFYHWDIEHISRHGNVVVVMGRDQVTNPPDEAIVHRRFTDIWQQNGSAWLMLARHAHVVSREIRP